MLREDKKRRANINFEWERIMTRIFVRIFVIFLCTLLTLVHTATPAPTTKPTNAPTAKPTLAPTISPTRKPSIAPTIAPTNRPQAPPTARPTVKPTYQPTSTPTVTIKPSPFPSSTPSSRPTAQPSRQPSMQPTSTPTGQPTGQPSFAPTSPTGQPTSAPNNPSSQPTTEPTPHPSYSLKPTVKPTASPTRRPSAAPSASPTRAPTTVAPSTPTSQPSSQPSRQPSRQPSGVPTSSPTTQPTNPTSQPTRQPTRQPSSQPTTWPTGQPSSHPTKRPIHRPTPMPTTAKPVSQPSSQPTGSPTGQPSSRPTAEPTVTRKPSSHPTSEPSRRPSGQPSGQPTRGPSGQPTSRPSRPTRAPTRRPTSQPSSSPSTQPTSQPTSQPSMQPSAQPSSMPTSPTSQPSSSPSGKPTAHPTPKPTVSFFPTSQPSSQPSSFPTAQPISDPTAFPTKSFQPTSFPTARPTGKPTSRPSFYGGFSFTSRPTAFYETIDVSGTVEFEPDSEAACKPVQMHITFAFTKNLTAGSTFTIGTPGITSGACYNASSGHDISSIYVPNDAKFTVSFHEGTYLDNFAGSYLSFYLGSTQISPALTYSIYIDRLNKLRRSCSLETNWPVTVYPNNGRISGTVGSLTVIETYPKKCFIFYSNIYFQNALPQFYTGINATLRLGYEVSAGTTITLHLPGFTNSVGAYPLNVLKENSSRSEAVQAGYDTALVNITSSTNFTWSGRWVEGDPDDQFQGSKIVLTAFGYQAFNDMFWVVIPKSHNHIIPICGHPANDATIKISTQSDYFYTNSTSVDETNVIGPGCGNLDQCSGFGTCDYCTSTCTCEEGHGSAEDRRRAIANDFLPDCSSKACPAGPSIGSVGIYSYAGIDGIYEGQARMHRLMECSANGVCNRKTGVCKCNPGFFGAACQKMKCGGTPACSGRGRCLPMRRLSRDAEALPLSTKSIAYVSQNLSIDSSWDADFGHACVCDSSWAVGLGSGETQLAEYFGTACEKRRCPSGDDPNTRNVDETDCEGIAMTGGAVGLREKGKAGNKCHVDCSNRGTCNYATGVCKCFDGFTGDNCGTYIT